MPPDRWGRAENLAQKVMAKRDMSIWLHKVDPYGPIYTTANKLKYANRLGLVLDIRIVREMFWSSRRLGESR